MRLTITLEDVEIEALKQSAIREMRPTKEQLRWLLRQALKIEDDNNTTVPRNSKSAGVQVCETDDTTSANAE